MSTNSLRHLRASPHDEAKALIFIRSGIAHASLATLLLCVSCGSTDSGSPTQGSAGQSGGHGGQGGAEQGQSGGRGGESGEGRGQNADAGHESAGATGDAGGKGDRSDGGDEGDGLETSGGASGAGASGGDGGHATGGATSSGGSPGSNECVWDPVAVDQCRACDGNGDCAEPGYKYVGSGAVTSSCCGFEWQEQTAPGKYTWSAASEYCATLSLSGRGWRLPKIAELFSLVDLSDQSHTSPTINVDALSDTLREPYWSSSPSGNGGQTAWTVNFSDGSSQPTAVDDAHPQRVRCVR